MGRVDGKTALVTGAAQGLGAAIAACLANEGARVLLSDLNAEGVETQTEQINAKHPGMAIACSHDVTDQDQWRDALALVERTYGGLHVLVNNAGIGSMANVENETLDNWRKVHAVNLDSVYLGCKNAIPLIAQSGGGSIVNLSSVSGIIASHNLAAYNSSKAAVRHLSKSIALHCARSANGIRCNSVHPAFTETPILDAMSPGASRQEIIDKLAKQVPLRRIGQPEDVAYAVLYLAADESAFVTGTELVVDGGISAM